MSIDPEIIFSPGGQNIDDPVTIDGRLPHTGLGTDAYGLSNSAVERRKNGTFMNLASEKDGYISIYDAIKHGAHTDSTDAQGRTALHIAALTENTEMAKFLLECGANMDKPDANGKTPMILANEQGNKDIQTLFNKYRNLDQRKLQTAGEEGREDMMVHKQQQTSGSFRDSDSMPDMVGVPSIPNNSSRIGTEILRNFKKRVSIHMHREMTETSRQQNGKLINLPDTLEELLKIGGKKFTGLHPTKVVNGENTEVDDLTVVRDGDHLFLVEEERERTE